jgi:hypothetical protein
MSVVLFYVVMGASVLFFVGLYLRDRPKKSAPPKQPEPPRWHKWFDDPV